MRTAGTRHRTGPLPDAVLAAFAVPAPDDQRRPSGPPAHPPAYLDVIDAAHRALGLTSDEIAAAVGAHATTLPRWRAGETAPLLVVRHCLTLRAERTAAVPTVRHRAGAADGRMSLGARPAVVPGSGGNAPRALLACGHLDRQAALLAAAHPAAAARPVGAAP